MFKQQKPVFITTATEPAFFEKPESYLHLLSHRDNRRHNFKYGIKTTRAGFLIHIHIINCT